MGPRVIAPQTAEKVLDHWLASEFEGGGSQPKVDKMKAIDARFRAAARGLGLIAGGTGARCSPR